MYARVFVHDYYNVSVLKSEQFSESVENCEPRGTDNVCEQTYSSIYLRQMKAIVFIILQIYFATHMAIVFIILQIFFATHMVWNIGKYDSDIPQSCDAFKPIVHK